MISRAPRFNPYAFFFATALCSSATRYFRLGMGLCHGPETQMLDECFTVLYIMESSEERVKLNE